MTPINWIEFQKRYESFLFNVARVDMIRLHLPHFDTRPDWVSWEVWNATIHQGGKSHTTFKKSPA